MVDAQENYARCPTHSDCFNGAERDFYSRIKDAGGNEAAIDKCFRSCPIECNTVMYDLKVSTADYPTLWYTKVLNDNGFYDMFSTGLDDYNGPTREILKSTTAMINVFYESMNYQIIQETPSLTFDTLFLLNKINYFIFLFQIRLNNKYKPQ